MDINDKVAARRRQLAEAERLARADARAAVQAKQVVEERRRREALDAVAAELSTPELPVHREGDALSLPTPPPDLLDPASVRPAALRRLLDREGRKAWTTGENWQVIGSICAGVALLHVFFLGFPLIAFGIWRGSRVGKRHRAVLIARHLELFGSLTA